MIQSEKAKAIVAAVLTLSIGIVGGGVAQGLINGAAAAWCTIVIGAVVATAATLGVYYQANKPPPPVP